MVELGPISAFMSSVTWSIGTTGYARLSKDYSAFTVSFLRSIVALPLFLISTFVVAGGIEEGLIQLNLVSANHLMWFAISMFASYGFGDVLFLFSTRSLGVPGALAISSIYPLWTALLGVMQGQNLSGVQTSGLFLTLACVSIVILTTDKESKPKNFNLKKGLVLAFLTSLLWALNGYAVNRGAQGLSTSVSNTMRMACAALMTPFFGRLFTPQSSILLPRFEIKKNIWIFVVEAFFGSMFFTYGLAHSPLAIGATLSSLAPVLTVPVAWIMGTEKPSIIRSTAICGVVIGLSLLM